MQRIFLEHQATADICLIVGADGEKNGLSVQEDYEHVSFIGDHLPISDLGGEIRIRKAESTI